MPNSVKEKELDGKFLERCPHHPTRDYEEDFVSTRRTWFAQRAGITLQHLSKYSISCGDVRGNVENFVGVAQVPIGIVGPVYVHGEYAQGTFHVPFATTEGALVSTYQRGAIALSKSGGATVRILKDENHLDPVFIFQNLHQATAFLGWLQANFSRIEAEAKHTTAHGRLVSITPHVVGRRVILDFAYETSDAMGANMINVATERACKFISCQQPAENYLLRSNFNSEKKASSYHLTGSYGKQVIADAILPRKIVERYLYSTPEKISSAWHSWALASMGSGAIAMNAHFANGLAAIFIACGQDVAHVVNGSVGLIMFELLKSGDLYASVKVSSLLVGTVGGGTALGTQRECLGLLGCYGQGKARKFAEIVTATLLAGEIGICAGITSEEFLEPHKRARVHTIAKAYEET